jgi:two-component system OmpR family response regulator
MDPRLSGKNLLVADDDADGMELLAIALQLEGADVRTARSAGESLAQLDGSWRPDALLLDIGMPQVDGYELLARIRERAELGSVPAIAVTAYAFKGDAAAASASGFAAHVPKPYDISELVSLLVDVLARAAS